ncbi:WecB/TagA/CpsF family glycosyltransferase [Amphiplicatus metriothermophilus]|uniref:N-acetylglucosaminyldiphosphoundecaprenol N-acetyl-beta-D-mannosaminyltransferase n=1 Tax=Amphiplicatus metriothermophilus TaxID=1519374 RepID=A0A239PJ41_9PROT|nr:WecB/TagA/CpsF family glycosyltransferase [Amphiplicatus metriothermophilus]MBB5517844.1 N-acetylglucosaminyldiphosphoundecaprenol N-acetyl-beta-D-mannosaminyltransferase [Amphiplicatus metriothermophilus]SNT67822.1 N-acetylglucosaminyldiphosphoundecaprenol N-acetyl-beta-D-mannosaminyltransferase [Amphiplicatus metriothermophilus]
MTASVSSRDVQVGRDFPAKGDVRALPRDDFDRPVWCVFGMPVDLIDLGAAAAAVEAAMRDRRRLAFITPNVHWLVRFLRDPEARRQTIDADMSFIDGAPLAALARLLGARVPGRVAGSDLFEALRARPGLSGRRRRIFFFGGEEGAAAKAAAALALDRGGLEPAGWLNPGFGDVESMSGETTIETVNQAEADMVVVSVSAAKGQAWIARNQHRLNAPVVANLGAVVNFTAGTVRRAPESWRRFGFEWLWRIREEPALWRRYATDGATLLAFAARRLPGQLLAMRAARRSGARADAMVIREPGATVVRLSGDLLAPDLAVVRRAFREAAASDAPAVRLDFAAVGRFDGAFMGLVLMLEKHARRRGARLETAFLSRAARAVFRSNAMNYPCSAGRSAGGGATAEAAVSA